MPDKFRVQLPKLWESPFPTYFNNFYTHCRGIARANGWAPVTVINHQLKPIGGKLIITNAGGWYLRWDQEACHTAFVLKWQ